MLSAKTKYYFRVILLITSLALLCLGGGLLVYLLFLAKTPNEGLFIFDIRGRMIGWTIIIIGFIGLLVVFKLLDYSRKIEDEEDFSSQWRIHSSSRHVLARA
jgi:xanthosine utilization system XapX-like protein